MILEEAIKHCEEVINGSECSECKMEHRQLQEWLEELKAHREIPMSIRGVLNIGAIGNKYKDHNDRVWVLKCPGGCYDKKALVLIEDLDGDKDFIGKTIEEIFFLYDIINDYKFISIDRVDIEKDRLWLWNDKDIQRDVDKLVKNYESLGIIVTREDAFNGWYSYSEDLSANWIHVDKNVRKSVEYLNV